MTAGEAIAASLCRAVVVALVAAAIGPAVAASLTGRRWMTALAAAPILTPGLLIGYVYRQTTLGSSRTATEAIAIGLLLAVTLPLAALAAALVPRTIDDRAVALWRRTTKASICQTVRQHIGRQRDRFAAGLLAGLWAFQESEVGILIQAAGWPEWTQRQLLGARSGGELLGELWPAVAIQVTIVAAGLALLRQTPLARVSRRPLPAASLVIIAAVTATTAYPVAAILHEASRGVRGLSRQHGLLTTLAWSMTLALAAATIAWWLARRSRRWRPVVWGLAVAGLLGSLLLAIGMQATLRTVWPSSLGQPWPHLVVLVVSVLPKAIVLAAIVSAVSVPRAIRAAELAVEQQTGAAAERAATVRFQIRDRPHVFSFAILAWTAYFDVMAASVLAAPALETTPLQLYNFVHSGQIVTLAAWLLLTAAAPLVLLAVGYAVSRRLSR